MGNCVIILGKSGTGKSTSIKNLDPKETVIFNTLKKRLPFKGSNTLYNIESKNMFILDEYTQLIQYLESISKNATHVKNIIIDDMIYIMRKCSKKSEIFPRFGGSPNEIIYKWRLFNCKKNYFI